MFVIYYSFICYSYQHAPFKTLAMHARFQIAFKCAHLEGHSVHEDEVFPGCVVSKGGWRRHNPNTLEEGALRLIVVYFYEALTISSSELLLSVLIWQGIKCTKARFLPLVFYQNESVGSLNAISRRMAPHG